MCTGIVSDVGQVRHIEQRGDTHLVIATHYDVSTVEIGASIACSGVCLTVVDKGTATDRWFAVTASGETLSKTTLAGWKVGDPVNLERPLKVGDELGGHIVTGHIDGGAELKMVVPEGESIRMVFEAPANLAPFIAPKGSVALDGISLTVNEVDGVRFGVNIIPHTQQVTTFGRLTPGMKVFPHVHDDFDQIATIVSGTAIYWVNGVANEVGPGSLILIPAGQPHYIEPTGTEKVLNLDVFGPPRKDLIHLLEWMKSR